jgi:hypothetical protein
MHDHGLGAPPNLSAVGGAEVLRKFCEDLMGMASQILCEIDGCVSINGDATLVANLAELAAFIWSPTCASVTGSAPPNR